MAVTTHTAVAHVALARVAAAPAGAHQLHEAALLWSRHRPVGWRTLGPPSPQRHLCLAHMASLDAAARLARLLSGVTWAIVTEGAQSPFAVAVPVHECRRVTRCLHRVWRACAKEPHSVGGQLAVAVWRTAILCATTEIAAEAVTVRTGDRVFEAMLLASARALGLEPVVCHDRACPARLVIGGRGQVRLLFENTTSSFE